MSRDSDFQVDLFLFALILISCAMPACAQDGQSGRGGGMMRDPKFQALMAEQKSKSGEFQAAEVKDAEEFSKTLAGKGKPEILEAVRAFKTEKYAKNCEFRDALYGETRAFAENFQTRGGSGETMKARMLKRLEANYEERKNFFKQKHHENMAFLDKLASDDSIQGQALMNKLQEFFRSQKEAAKAYMGKRRGH